MVLIKYWALFSSIFNISGFFKTFLEAGRNKFCSGINTKSWVCAGVQVPARKERSQRSPAHGYHRVQFHFVIIRIKGLPKTEAKCSWVLREHWNVSLHCRKGYLKYVNRLLGLQFADCTVTHSPNRGIINPGSLLCSVPLVSSFWHIAISDNKPRHKHTCIFKETLQTPHFLFSKKVCPKDFWKTRPNDKYLGDRFVFIFSFGRSRTYR